MPFRINMSKRTVILVTGIIFCISIPSCFGTTIYLKPILSHSSPKTLVSLEKLEKTRPEKRIAPMIRVAWNDPALIKKAYDVGAVAVMVS